MSHSHGLGLAEGGIGELVGVLGCLITSLGCNVGGMALPSVVWVGYAPGGDRSAALVRRWERRRPCLVGAALWMRRR